MTNASASQLLGRERGMRTETQILEGNTFLVSQKGQDLILPALPRSAKNMYIISVHFGTCLR